jgi:long-chain acyl-CoA synthetase
MEVLCPAVQPDWVRTTDLISIDPDGFVWHRGRFDNAIVRGGFKILPESIVAALRKHPGVTDAAVVGLPDPRLGAAPAAMVEARPGWTLGEDELKTHLRDHLPSTHIPVRIAIVDELPRNTALKVSLAEVKERLLALVAAPAQG